MKTDIMIMDAQTFPLSRAPVASGEKSGGEFASILLQALASEEKPDPEKEAALPECSPGINPGTVMTGGGAAGGKQLHDPEEIDRESVRKGLYWLPPVSEITTTGIDRAAELPQQQGHKISARLDLLDGALLTRESGNIFSGAAPALGEAVKTAEKPSVDSVVSRPGQESRISIPGTALTGDQLKGQPDEEQAAAGRVAIPKDRKGGEGEKILIAGEPGRLAGAEKSGLKPAEFQPVAVSGFKEDLEPVKPASVDRTFRAVPDTGMEKAGIMAETVSQDQRVHMDSSTFMQQSRQPLTGQGGMPQPPPIQGDAVIRPAEAVDLPQSESLRQSVMQQVESKVIYLRENRTSPAEMRLTLHPPDLGEVTIRVFSKQGKLSASIITETPLAREVLEGSAAELRQRLNFISIEFKQLDFMTSGEQHGGSYRPGDEQDTERFASGIRANPDPASEDNEPVYSHPPPGSPDRGVDYWA
jgi:type III secretion system needle length determinant